MTQQKKMAAVFGPQMEKLAAIYSAGKKPTYDEMEQGFLETLKSNEVLSVIFQDMQNWLCSLAIARKENDVNAINDILDTFIANRTKPVHPESKEVH